MSLPAEWGVHTPWVTGECVGSDSDSPDGDYVFPGDLPQSLSQYLEQEIDLEVSIWMSFSLNILINYEFKAIIHHSFITNKCIKYKLLNDD